MTANSWLVLIGVMNYESLAIGVAFGLLTLGLVALLCKLVVWWEEFTAKRFIDRLMREPDLDQDALKLLPESRYIVAVSDSTVSCKSPDGSVESVNWDDLQRVEVVTTDEGPFFPDVFWVLHGSETGCVVPQGATGEKALLHRLEQLPSFDDESFMKAMCSTSNQRFDCWRRMTVT